MRRDELKSPNLSQSASGNISLFQRTTEATVFGVCVYVREFEYAYFFIPLLFRKAAL